jgi:hypothetical protein
VALQQQWQAMRVNRRCGRGRIIGDERKGRGVGRESPDRQARVERRSSTDGPHRHPGPRRQWHAQRRARAGRVGFREIILGKILRDLTKLWEFS